MKHVCEICNTQYGTVAEAERCELAHKKEMEQEAVKATAESKISDAVNAYVAKYKVMPDIDLTEENQRILIGDIAGKVGECFDLIISMLGEEDCDEEECPDIGCEGCTGCTDKNNSN